MAKSSSTLSLPLLPLSLFSLLRLLFFSCRFPPSKVYISVENKRVQEAVKPSFSPETPFMYAIDVGSPESKYSMRDLGPPPPELPLDLLEKLRQEAEKSPEGRVVGMDVRIIAGFSPQENGGKAGGSSHSVEALKHFTLNKIMEHLPRTFLIPDDKKKEENKDVFIKPDDRKFPFIYDIRYWKGKSTQ
ncbi:hypothetical protein PENTCL1PPCAC_2556, partial [Pristionchus entomophagus]